MPAGEEREPVSVDKERLVGLLDRLQGLIDEDLGAAEELIDELNQLTGGSEWSALLGKIADSLDEFDVDTARRLIEELRKKFRSS